MSSRTGDAGGTGGGGLVGAIREIVTELLNGRLPRVIRFLLVGGFGAVVNLACVWIATHYLELDVGWASAFGIFWSVFSNYVINSTWTFSSSTSSSTSPIDEDQKKKDQHSTRKLSVRVLAFFISCVRYYIASSLAIAVQFLISFLLLPYIPVIYITQIVGILFGTAVNYYVQSRWTFGASTSTKTRRKRKSTTPPAILPI